MKEFKINTGNYNQCNKSFDTESYLFNKAERLKTSINNWRFLVETTSIFDLNYITYFQNLSNCSFHLEETLDKLEKLNSSLSTYFD